MVKKKITKSEVKEQHYCGDCGHGQWYFDHTNLDVHHKLPICCKCKYRKYSNVRSDYACINWKPKKDNELSITPKYIKDGRIKR